MREFRSFIFGGFAMLAAALCLSTPATALDVGSAVYAVKLTVSDYYAPDVFKLDASPLKISALSDRSTNDHTVEYNIQNQPHSAFRFAVDAHKHIDPHIAAKR